MIYNIGIYMKKTFNYGALLLVVLMAVNLFAAPAKAAESIGTVILAVHGAWVERDGGKALLGIEDSIKLNDTVVTDATGKVQILFNDHTTIAVGNNSTITVSDFVYGAGKASTFTSRMTKGVARFVTGKIVEQNRAGFSVTTPAATVGIRGTTFAVEVPSAGVTEVTGLSIDPAFPVTVTNTGTGAMDTIDKSGLAIKVASVGSTKYLAPAGKFSRISEAVSIAPAERQKSSDGTGGKSSPSSGEKADSAQSSEERDSDDSNSSGSSENGSGTSGGASGTSALGNASEQGRLSLSGSLGADSGSASGSDGSSAVSSAIVTAAQTTAGLNDAGGGGVMPASAMRLVASIPTPAVDVVSPGKDAAHILADITGDNVSSVVGTSPGTPGSGSTGTGATGGTTLPASPGIIYTATYSGSLYQSWNGTVGGFSFDVNLTGGVSEISSASATYSGGNFTLADSALVQGGHFDQLGLTSNGVDKLSMSGAIIDGTSYTPSSTAGTWNHSLDGATVDTSGGFIGYKE